MQRGSRPDGLEMPSSVFQRNRSVSSDRTSPFSGSSLNSPPSIRPEPAYIALSAASQIVNTDRAERGYLERDESKVDFDTAIVTPGSVSLVNGFLDQLLYNFLACSRSTSIAALRPAIQEVLKPKLAKEAIQGADEELEGYMAGGDAEELLAFHGGQSFRGDYDLNLIWRRTRLRCMVYSRLGDMEEEDKETYLDQEQENDSQGQRRLSRDLGSISPAAAIFLTNVLEFIGEHAMLLAGEAAYNRFQTRGQRPDNPRAIVEEIDMEKLAFNGILGRLWRSWKKRVRSASLLSPRPGSFGRHKTSSFSDTASRKTSISEGDELGYFDNGNRPSPMEFMHKDRMPAAVPAQQDVGLPEEPDFSGFWVETPVAEKADADGGRRRSMIEVPKHDSRTPTQTPFQLSQPDSSAPSDPDGRPTLERHQRSSSLPIRQTSFGSPMDEAFATPRERPDPLDRDYDRADAKKELPRLTDDSATVSGRANEKTAVSTMYDGTISKGTESAAKDISSQPGRGMSTYTESSSYTDEYDHELAPQALNFNGSSATSQAMGNAPVNGLLPGSRDSIVSSGDSIQGGEKGPVAHPVTSTQLLDRKENESEGAFPTRADSRDQENENGRSGHVGNLANLAMLQGHQLRTYDESGKAVKRDIPVLYDGPSNKDVIYNPDANVRSSTGPSDGRGLPTPTGAENNGVETGSRPIPKEQGVSTLTPLEELMGAARDSSDEASSNSASHEKPKSDACAQPAHRSQGLERARNDKVSAINTGTSQTSMSASKPVVLRGQPLLVNIGTERAAVQRVSPTSTPIANGRTSTSSNREGRPMTASSSTSQVSSRIKGMIGQESGDLTRQPIPRRSSSDGSTSLVNGIQRTPRSADKEQDFEDLIKSEETVKYTLTPQSVREMETSESPRYQAHARSETQGSFTGSLNGINGLRSNPTKVTEFAKGPSSSEIPQGPPQAPPKSPGVRSGRVPAPREADAKNHNMRDFADFIRSTGPDAVPRNTPVTPGTTKKERPGSSSSQAGPKKLTKTPSMTSTKQSYSSPPAKPEVAPKRSASKLQAREATVTNNNVTADLAKFLRSDPDRIADPRGGQRPGAHIQPAMTTNGTTDGRQAVGSGTSVASTQGSFAASKMTQSSTNSRTGLLDTSHRAHPSNSDAGRNSSAPSPRSIDIPPSRARKQRRIKDPYAIESDDENEDSLMPPEREEESLSDFLRNYTPPPAAATRPPPIGIPGAPKPAKQSVTLKERIQRNIAVIPDYRPLPPKAPKKPSSSKSPPQSNESRRKSQRQNSNNLNSSPLSSASRPSATRNASSGSTAPQLPPINPRAASPHLVSQNGTKMDSYRPTQPTYAKHVDRRPKQLQAREEPGALSGPQQSGGMGDLADFLRETEPPPPSGPIGGMRPMSPTKEKEESSGFGRMFGRRKKEAK